LKESLKRTGTSILTFDAEEECKDVGCFYNWSNWWVEEFIHSGEDVQQIEKLEDDNFFL
jgi:hypothetical protein